MASSNNESYDVIIVGAGILGLYTSYTMVKKGLRVLLLDQFQIPHKRGSSGDASRLIRLFYEQENYAAMVLEAYRHWQELELVTGEQLLHVTGALAVYDGNKNRKRLVSASRLMKQAGLKHDVLTTDQMNTKFPQFRFDAGSMGLYDYSAGCLMAVKCNRVLLTEFMKHGGTLRDAEKVIQITPGNVVRISTSRGQHYYSHQVVLTPGPWASDLLFCLGLDLPLKTLPALPCYWKEKVPGSHSPDTGMPIFVHYLEVPNGYRFIHGFPSLEYPGMIKVGTRGEPALEMHGPDDRDRQDRNRIIGQLSDYIQYHLPGLEGDAPAITEGCMYTRTPDGDFIIDRHPQFPNILFACGGSGHAFKMAPTIGKLLTEMATGSATSYDMTLFRVNRFMPTAKI